ncbi:MAG: hypothetical protein KAZ63_08465 [Vitreoscilla sp.]|jgi:hypothetical protein|nr:hypothetical protein [Vitreoscilla sp.]
MTLRSLLAIAVVGSLISACANVDVTKTSMGVHAATDANTIEILKTRPDKAYVELGTITVTGFDASDSAKMHNAIRAKAAPLGATAVILTDEGLIQKMFGMDRWATGVAIRYK